MAGRRGEVGGGREVVGRRGENFGVEKRWKKKKKIRAGRMGFSFIRKTASTGSSATGALVAANSLQPTGCSWVVVGVNKNALNGEN
jgi:hypothetical protein